MNPDNKVDLKLTELFHFRHYPTLNEQTTLKCNREELFNYCCFF